MELKAEKSSDSKARAFLIGHVIPNYNHSRVLTFTVSASCLYFYLFNIFL